ncbi:hypothetical protein [Streptomyces sp. NPDC014805]|uniref:hypothetical protein n=1 Tax=Streptomyces sp. NPDC014805 TaxID=3364919 RepID=UPI003701EAB8
MKRKSMMQIRAAALVAVPSMIFTAAVCTAGTAQAAPRHPHRELGSMRLAPGDGDVRVTFWQGISFQDESDWDISPTG